MRPRRLSLSGFGSFRDRVDLDFEGIDYFALVGPTGHGKSTVVDAIGSALYGQVPRYHDTRVVRQVVSLGGQETRVELEFSAGADTYVVTRVVKVRNGKPKQEGRLERLLADGTTESLAGSVRELDKKIASVLGLEFDDFTKCVVLPQGAFQQFLHDKPGDRRAVLVRLLNLELYERLGQRARELAGARRMAADADQEQLDRLGEIGAEAEAEARDRHTTLVALGHDVTNALPVDQELATRAERATTRAETASAFVQALAKVRVPGEVAALGETVERAQRQLRTLEEAVALATDRRTDAEKLADEHEPDVLQALANVHRQLQAERTGLVGAQKALAASAKAERAAKTTAKKAREELDRADDTLHAARVAHGAHALAGELEVGAPCPVCTQKVKALPDVAPIADLDAARAVLETAKSAVEQAERKVTKEGKAHAANETLVSRHHDAIAQLEPAVAEHPDAEAVVANLDAARAAREVANAAAKAEREATDAERSARKQLDQLVQQLERVERTFTAQRDPLVPLEPPAPAGDDVVGSWHALAAWASEQVEVQQAAVADATTTAEAANRERHELAAALVERGAKLGVRGRNLGELHPAVVRAEAQAHTAVERIVEQRAAVTALAQQVQQRRDEERVAAELGRLLRSDQFVEWLVVEALATLVESASALLRQLSNGAYSLQLDDDGEFAVVDHANADETRSVRTLSGGETFQAALALALALSDHLSTLAADGAPRLDAMFLDEGFGSLDPESLDVVASTIETLGTSGRMVGIVTHVRELADRVPVRFEVRKQGRSSTVDVVTA